MALFNFGKKKEEKNTSTCCCGSTASEAKESAGCCCSASKAEENTSCCCKCSANSSSIKVLGAGCKSCHDQYEYAKKAVSNLDLDIEVEYITDMEKVMAYGVMSMPAIVVNEQVVSMGKVLKAAEVEKLLHKIGY